VLISAPPPTEYFAGVTEYFGDIVFPGDVFLGLGFNPIPFSFFNIA
jgi:hypothetical protein